MSVVWIYRVKEGFSVPIKDSLKTTLRPQMEALLSVGRLGEAGLFVVRHLERLKAGRPAGRVKNSPVLCPMMVFEDWRRRWMA